MSSLIRPTIIKPIRNFGIYTDCFQYNECVNYEVLFKPSYISTNQEIIEIINNKKRKRDYYDK